MPSEFCTLVGNSDKITRESLQNIIDNIPGYIFWKDVNSVIIGGNENFAKLAGETVSSILGKSDYELPWKPEETEHFIRDDQEVIKTGVPKLNIEEQMLLANGKEITILTNKVPLRDTENKIIGVIGIFTDITEKKRMEKQLEQARKLQEKSHSAKIQGMMEIAAGIAHEIRTPLISIQCATDAKVYLERLIAAYEIATEAGLPVENIRPSHMQGLKNIFNSIDAEAKESMNIIDMFLSNLKNMVKQANSSDYQLCSLKEAITASLARYPFASEETNLVHYNTSNDFKFYGVNLLVQHILFNLLKNALCYLNTNPSAKISIWHEPGDTDNILYFEDTGPGISEYDQTRIFDFGFSKRKGGSGFGLTYCKNTMQQMGGDVAVQSELGKYTRFILTFPKVAT